MILLALLLAVRQQPQASADGAAPAVQMGVMVRPAAVTVGDHFTIEVRVRAPKGAVIGFPAGPDSGLFVEAVDPRQIESVPDTGAVDRTAIYRLVAWDTGGQAAHLGSVVVSLGGVDRRLAITGDTVRVRSVLPADTAKQIPRPARDIIVAGRPWWQWAILGAAALALLALFCWWWRRRRRHIALAPADTFHEARQAFSRIDALGLLEAGERGRYVALHIEVLRAYLAARLTEAHPSLTSTELVEAVRYRRQVPVERLAPVLAESDLVKFARRPVTIDRARELGREARALVDDIERAMQAEPARAAAAAGRAA